MALSKNQQEVIDILNRGGFVRRRNYNANYIGIESNGRTVSIGKRTIESLSSRKLIKFTNIPQETTAQKGVWVILENNQ